MTLKALKIRKIIKTHRTGKKLFKNQKIPLNWPLKSHKRNRNEIVKATVKLKKMLQLISIILSFKHSESPKKPTKH